MGIQNPITTTTNAAIVPEIWSSRFFEVLRAKLPFLSLIDFSYEGDIQALGDTVNVSTIADFDEASELVEGAFGDAEVPSVTGQQLVINKRTYKDFLVTSEAKLQSLPFMDSLREKAVYAIQKRMQSVIIGDIVPSAAAPDHQISYTTATTLALGDIQAVKVLHDNANVDDDVRHSVLGASQLNNIFSITGFVSRDFIPAGSPMTSGKIETPVLGYNINPTTVVGNTSYWFHPSFMTMAMQQALNVEVASLAPMGGRGSRVNCDILWGLKQLDNKRVVSLS